MAEAEYGALITFYRCTKDTSMVCWRKFDADIESSNKYFMFSALKISLMVPNFSLQKGLNQMPSTLTPSPKRIVDLPYPGATNMEDVPLPVRQLVKCAVARLRHRVLIQSCNIKYFSKDRLVSFSNRILNTMLLISENNF